MNKAIAVLVLAAVCTAQPPGGGPPGQTGSLVCSERGLTRCPMVPPFQATTVTTNSQFRLIETTGCPPYQQNWTVTQEACINPRTIEIPLSPRPADTPVPIVTALSEYQGVTYLEEAPTPVLGSIGVFDNGVYIYGSSSPCGFGSACPAQDSSAPSQYVDAVDSEGDTIDFCGGHPTPIDLEYHVHSGEMFAGSNAGRELCGLPIDTEQHSARLGWMYDGYGLYGRFSLDRQVPTDLDQCGGHTHEIDGVETYHYHIQDQFPWIIGCFRGCPRVENSQNQLAFANTGDYGCSVEDPTDDVAMPTDGAERTQTATSVLILLICTAILFVYP